MKDAYILGVGQIPVAKYSDEEVGKLGGRAILRALKAAQLEEDDVTALYAGNMLSGVLCQQQLLGPLLANAAGLTDCEVLTIEAACGSGAGAMRAGMMAIASGAHRAVVVCGVEKMSHASREDATRGLATASHWPTEGGMGESFLTLNARLMTAYRDAYGLEAADFAPFAINAHGNAVSNDCAMLRKSIDLESYMASREIAPPIRLYDAPPICDGAAALVLGNAGMARAVRALGLPVVKVLASACASDFLALSERSDLLSLSAARLSAQRAYREAEVDPEDIDLFEPHDAYTVMTALSLEASGFAERGCATRLARDGELTLEGSLPITTFGGLKARGHPVGATGVYQLVECFMQLTDGAGDNQVPNASIAMAQNLGGAAGVAFTHILARD